MLLQGLWRISGPNSGPLGSMVELVRQKDRLKDVPPRRGCGCPTAVVAVLTVALAVVLMVALLRCEYSPDDSTATGHDGAIAETMKFLPAEE